MERWLTRMWYEGGAAALALAPLAWMYGAGLALRRARYARRARPRAAVPVVVVGNLTVGGTGKTPLVLWLAHALAAQGIALGIVSRGYGARGSAPRAVEEHSDWRVVGDEPVLLARHAGCPVVVARDRVAAVAEAARRGARLILSDDGLQHLAMPRACELVVIDALRGFGNGRLLPAGPLREPRARLAGVDAIVFNGSPSAELAQEVRRFARGPVLSVELTAGPLRSVAPPVRERALAELAGQPVHAVAGIGHPARFFRTLKAAGVRVIEHAFPDHHPFRAGELDFADALPILMTEKDAVRCRSIATERMWYVPVSASLSPHDAATLLACVRARAAV